MPGVDVVIPNYRYARYLPGCVASVLDQGIDDVRVLIIDNASDDGSVEVAQQIAAADPRVEVHARTVNQGPHASFNEGIDWARSDYFVILCADDLLAPGALRRATAVMDRHPEVHLTFGRTVSIAPDDDAPPAPPPGNDPPWTVTWGRDLLEQFCRTGRNHVHGPTAIVRTRIQKRVGYYRPELSHTDDLELWMRFTRFGSAAETEAVQAYARVHPLNQSATVRNVHYWDREFAAAFDSFFGRDGASLPNAQRLHRLARRSLAERAYWGAWSNLLRGDPKLSLDLIRSAVGQCPDMAIVPPVGHLMRRADTASKAASLLAGSIGRLQGRASPATGQR